ncbi:allatotropins-like [Macrosteles quadrilineatus]|uniref:allatotropins-like n=1 Tax=Macrosteles quadrilineatus TaxID=74068 RepID=UPI0023E18719|nr:allatotropins-like [Macrosteles quadrilineatus]
MGSMRAYTVLMWLLILLVTVATGNVPVYMRDKPRSIRGFKNHALSTARGFGKRADSEMISPDMPPTNEANSFPADWFADELQNNGELARLIVHKFIDSNQDGELSADELLRPLFEKPQAIPYK